MLRSLDRERGAATAGALDLGVLELEAGGLEGLDVVDGAAVQIHGAGGVDEDLQVAELDDLVHHAGLVLKAHGVLETGTAAAHHTNAQTGRDRILGRHNFLDLGDGGFGQLDSVLAGSLGTGNNLSDRDGGGGHGNLSFPRKMDGTPLGSTTLSLAARSQRSKPL